MPADNPAAESLKIEQRVQGKASRRKGRDGELHDVLEDTFPASDPVAMQTSVTPGAADNELADGAVATAGERVTELQQLLLNEVWARPLRALGWAAAAGVMLGFWAAR